MLRYAHTRFRFAWEWNGEEAVLQSRCTDEQGEVQPTIAEAAKILGVTPEYFLQADHFNGIQPWKVNRDGSISECALLSCSLAATDRVYCGLVSHRDCAGAGTDLSAGHDAERRGDQGARHGRLARRKRTAAGQRHASKKAQPCTRRSAPACHGPNGTGTALHRGLVPLGNAKPVKIEGSLVPYATTVWDFINRAMPWTKPGSLHAERSLRRDRLRALSQRRHQGERRPHATTLPKVRMPNRDNFVAVELDWKPGQRRPLGHYPGL